MNFEKAESGNEATHSVFACRFPLFFAGQSAPSAMAGSPLVEVGFHPIGNFSGLGSVVAHEKSGGAVVRLLFVPGGFGSGSRTGLYLDQRLSRTGVLQRPEHRVAAGRSEPAVHRRKT